MSKTLNRAAAAAFKSQCPAFSTVLYRNSTKGGALAFKIQPEEGAEKTLDFESSIEVLEELGSLYKMEQL